MTARSRVSCARCSARSWLPARPGSGHGPRSSSLRVTSIWLPAGLLSFPAYRGQPRLPGLHLCRAVMNSAIAANSARTSSGISVSARHLLAAASCASASVSAHFRPPACSTSPAAAEQLVLGQRLRPGQQLGQLGPRPRCRWSARPPPAATSSWPAGRTRPACRSPRARPRCPSRSSVSWKASPTWAPNPARPMASSAGAPTQMAPMLHAQAISAAVLSPAICRHSSRVHVVAALEGQVGALAGDQPLHGGGQAAGRPDALRGRVLSSMSWARPAARRRPGSRRRRRTRSRRSAGACARCRRP